MKSVLRVEFYYGNKTNFNLTNISTNITVADELIPGKRKFHSNKILFCFFL